MKIESVSFRDLPFSKLFHDYLSGNNNLAEYFEYNPFSDEALKDRVEQFQFQNDREKVVEVLKKFNGKFDATENTFNSIEKLKNEKCLAVVTGQQMIVYGGPLFTIYKILTAILNARQLEKKLKRDIVPVFWLADEDHDYQEAATIGIPANDDIQKIYHDALEGSEMRISELKASSEFSGFRKHLTDLMPDTDFTPDLWELLDSCYGEGEYLGVSFGKLILQLFGKYGLILAGSNDKECKKLMVEPLVQSVKSADSIEEELKETSQNLNDEGYHSQVTVQRSNLFWIDKNKKRKKIQSEGNRWFIEDTGQEWSSEELVQQIRTVPDSFSPNVFLRPVVQNHLIPALGYVAGPGEIAYYAQMRSYYRHFKLQMPIIIPRFSITILESPIARITSKLPFQLPEYINRIEDLEKMYMERSDTPDIETIFEEWKEDVTEISDIQVKKIADIDQTLKKSADKTVTLFFTELDKLKGKLYRSVKEDEKIQLRRINKIQNHLYPDRNLQEREVAFIYIMNKYGPDIWDRILDLLSDQKPNNHKYLFL